MSDPENFYSNHIVDIGFAIVNYAEKTITIKDGWTIKTEKNMSLEAGGELFIKSGTNPKLDGKKAIWMN